ncbi:MAG: formimidoylglutamate deiminase [Alphaproteobacteria bacterium]
MGDNFHWFETAMLPTGWAERVRVTVSDGRISAVAEDVEPQARDHRGQVALPGLPNLHSHAFQRAMAGLTEVRGPTSDSFWTWRDLMYRFVDRLDPEMVEAVAAMAFVEMLESGFTRVGEFHYLHHDPGGRPYSDRAEMATRVASAADVTGIGLTLLPVFYAHAGFGGLPPLPGQRRFTSSLESFGRLLEASRSAVSFLPDAVVGAAPHSLRATTEQDLVAVAAFAGGPIHIHIAEQVQEVDDCLVWSGARPVAWLLDHLPVDPGWCLVHATHMTAEETRRLAASGAVAGLCPITEANLGDGLFPARDFLAGGGTFGIGSDSNVRIDATEELRLLEYGQRLYHRARNLLSPGPRRSTGAALYRGALAGGSQALGAPAALRTGASADIVVLDAQHPDLAGRSGDALLDSLVFAAGSRLIKEVWRAGVRVVENGRHRYRDQIVARYHSAMDRLTA